MLGWELNIWHDGESVLCAYSRDISLDQAVRENAEQGVGGNGYPNKYMIRNDRLPHAEIYEWETTGYREFELGPLPDVPENALLSVELSDQS